MMTYFNLLIPIFIGLLAFSISYLLKQGFIKKGSDNVSIKYKSGNIGKAEFPSDLIQFMLKAYSKSSKNKIKLSEDIIVPLTSLLLNQSLSKKINFQISNNIYNLPAINIDENIMKQVFYNLLTNAIKYSNDNSTILITSKKELDNTTIDITYYGIPILENEAEEIFKGKYRGVEKNVIGSGIGLWVSKEVLKNYESSISIKNEAKTQLEEIKIKIPDKLLDV